MAARCYFVPRVPGGGQHQWWGLCDDETWVCRLWMDEADGVMHHGKEAGYNAVGVKDDYFAVVEADGRMVRVW